VKCLIQSRPPEPPKNKQAQQNQIDALLEKAGLAYDRAGGCFYFLRNCWQRGFGYCRLYDEACPAFGMILDAEPIEFTYGGTRWLIELWKGQYGIATGAEIGLYRDGEEVKSPLFTGTFYEAVPDSGMMKMSFTLKKNGRVILRRAGRHFWLSGFLLGEFSKPRALTMNAKIVFPGADMAEVFTGALENLGYTKREYSRTGSAVRLRYRKPHGKRNLLERARDRAVQLVNDGNCRLYRAVTASCADPLDALERLYNLAPHIFDFMLRALYSHALFDAFKWLRARVKPEPPRQAELPEETEPPAELPGLPSNLSDPPDPPAPPERPPLILPAPVLVPKNSYPFLSPAPALRAPEPSCISELERRGSERRTPARYPGRPYQGGSIRGGRQRP